MFGLFYGRRGAPTVSTATLVFLFVVCFLFGEDLMELRLRVKSHLGSRLGTISVASRGRGAPGGGVEGEVVAAPAEVEAGHQRADTNVHVRAGDPAALVQHSEQRLEQGEDAPEERQGERQAQQVRDGREGVEGGGEVAAAPYEVEGGQRTDADANVRAGEAAHSEHSELRQGGQPAPALAVDRMDEAIRTLEAAESSSTVTSLAFPGTSAGSPALPAPRCLHGFRTTLSPGPSRCACGHGWGGATCEEDVFAPAGGRFPGCPPHLANLGGCWNVLWNQHVLESCEVGLYKLNNGVDP
jgi:hypothetical protein